jgi:hypothetical protein
VHHDAPVRLTVNLEEGVYRMAKAYAASEDCSISRAINRLLRRLMEPASPALTRRRERFPVSSCRESRTITAEDVYRLDAEDEWP